MLYHPLHVAQIGPPPLISAQFNQALQLALPLLSGLPEGQAYGGFPTWVKWISTLRGLHQVLLSSNQWTASTLHPFLRADQELLDITETLTFLPPIHHHSIRFRPQRSAVPSLTTLISTPGGGYGPPPSFHPISTTGGEYGPPPPTLPSILTPHKPLLQHVHLNFDKRGGCRPPLPLFQGPGPDPRSKSRCVRLVNLRQSQNICPMFYIM